MIFLSRKSLFLGTIAIVAASMWSGDSPKVSEEPTVDSRIPPSLVAWSFARPFDASASFGTDLRDLRKPRQRSDRPTKHSIETDFTASIFCIIDVDRSTGHAMSLSATPATLAGHPLELLRPPSLAA